jgi:hypothetical protein
LHFLLWLIFYSENDSDDILQPKLYQGKLRVKSPEEIAAINCHKKLTAQIEG